MSLARSKCTREVPGMSSAQLHFPFDALRVEIVQDFFRSREECERHASEAITAHSLTKDPKSTQAHSALA